MPLPLAGNPAVLGMLKKSPRFMQWKIFGYMIIYSSPYPLLQHLQCILIYHVHLQTHQFSSASSGSPIPHSFTSVLRLPFATYQNISRCVSPTSPVDSQLVARNGSVSMPRCQSKTPHLASLSNGRKGPLVV